MHAREAVPEIRSQEVVLGSVRSLLAQLIDYAGLFPPAGLGMSETVANYASYLAEPHAWILGRFIVPANRLAEFERAQSAIQVTTPWRLSCLIGTDLDRDLSEIARFRSGPGSAKVESIETKAQTVEQVASLMSILPGGVTVYFEVPHDCSRELLTTVRRLGARAKLRTGGLNPDAIPETSAVGGFLAQCVFTGTPFKATAGLHHAIRHVRPLAYEAAAPCAKMHGFLNVFLAAMLAYHKVPVEQVNSAIEAEAPEYFRFENAVARCGGVSLSTEQIQAAREKFAVSFGSCSFEEPIEDLQSLGLL